MPKFTVATPTYNRANVLHRVYESLQAQTYRDFEWIVVDDGSKDNTREIVAQWEKEADFPIRYFYQENTGKHMAVNLAVKKANGELFITADSDDSFRPESLKVMLAHWEDIPEQERCLYRGVTCRCYNPDTNEVIGMAFPNGKHDVLGIESAFKYHYTFEMWGFNRTDVMKEYPYPDTREQGLSFYPETVIWQRMGLKYKVRFVDDALRAYYTDQENAATNRKRNRSKENIHLWKHYINNVLSYFWYDPKVFIKAFVGLSMDGLLLHQKPKEIIKIPKTALGKVLAAVFFPAGFLLYLIRKS